ncbi:cyclin [Xylogone sp. PMI_703]|nr:cyclin [Xylogone sp. PMI_703]
MNCGRDDSPPYIASYHGPYGSSLASSASSSSASVWSDASSQTSDDTSITGSSDPDTSSETYSYGAQAVASSTSSSNTCEQGISIATYWPKHKVLPACVPEQPQQQRQHPRRTSTARCPPPLVRQCDRKVNFVDSLVDSSAQIVEAIWPLSSVTCRSEMGNKGVLPLRTFIQETLRRSRTSYSTLQVALYYLILIKPHVPKHDFTMEQPEDGHSSRALQCGRRMFLAALILASKYLQDRNYSARAWSKISGLNTLEINQNEMAFLLAVNWKLHITDAVFQRWTDIVLKYTPSQPPSPSAAACPRIAEQSADWKTIVLMLNPELDNIEGILPSTSKTSDTAIAPPSPRPSVPSVERAPTFGCGSLDSTPTPKYYTPSILEPSPSIVYPKLAPSLGLLPTPRLTPQSTGYSTPAVSTASHLLGKSSMSLAMGQNSSACAAQATERWHSNASPLPCIIRRRSSLANSVSSASSPESMISDTSSRSSRSSSISSASSLMSAPLSSKLDVQARCRYAKLCSEKQGRMAIPTVPEIYCAEYTSSPDSYTGSMGKDFIDLSLGTPLAKRDCELDYFSRDSEHDAARALQELHSHPRMESPIRAGAKRSRPLSLENSLQENVREMLNEHFQPCAESGWSDSLVRSRAPQPLDCSSNGQVAVQSTSTASLGRKRICCGSEASRVSQSSLHPAFGGFGGPGMWEGILN